MLCWFKKEPKKCTTISAGYNPNNPEMGFDLFLGVGEDDACPGLPEREIAYIHCKKPEDLDWLIEWLQNIKNKFNKPSE